MTNSSTVKLGWKRGVRESLTEVGQVSRNGILLGRRLGAVEKRHTIEQNVQRRTGIQIRMPQTRAPLGKLIIPKRPQAQRDVEDVACKPAPSDSRKHYTEKAKEIDLQEPSWH